MCKLSLIDQIKRVIKQSTFLGIAKSELSVTTRLDSSLGLDSLGKLDLMVKLDEMFDIDLNSDFIDSWVTVEDVIDAVLSELR